MLDLDSIPVRSPVHHVQDMGGEQVVYGQARATAYFLNETAAMILHLCDGQRSVGEIVDLLAGAYPEASELVRADVLSSIGNLMAEGVIGIGTSAGSGKAA